jgi:hypothetical protein
MALFNAKANIPGMSTPATPEILNVFAVDVVRVFRLVTMVVLGTMLMVFLFSEIRFISTNIYAARLPR